MGRKKKRKKFTVILGFMTLIIILLQLYSSSLNVELSTKQYSNLLHEMEILERGDLVNNRMMEVTKETGIITMRMVANDYFNLEINETEFQEQYRSTLEQNLERLDLIQQILDERDILINNLYENFSKEAEFKIFVNGVDTWTSTLTMAFILGLFVYITQDYFNYEKFFNQKEIEDKDKKTKRKKKKTRKK